MNSLFRGFLTNILFTTGFVTAALAEDTAKLRDSDQIKKIIDLVIEYSVKYSFQA